MKTLIVYMSVVFFFGFTLVVNAEELEEPAGCKTGAVETQKVRIHQTVGWHNDVLTQKPVLRVALEIEVPQTLQVEFNSVWIHVVFEDHIVFTKKVPYTINWDGERGYIVYFDQNQLPAGAEIEYTLKGVFNGLEFYESTGGLNFQSDPKELSPLPGQFDGLEMLSPPAPKAPVEKQKRQGADQDRRELARA